MREQREQEQEQKQKQEGSTTKAFASLTNQPQEPELTGESTMTTQTEDAATRSAARDATLCRQYFAKHHAEYQALVFGVGSPRARLIERLAWRQPGTSINAIEYVCSGGGILYVSGDLGDAVYSTGAQDLAWWARCGLHYFASKCDASEYGRGYRTWDRDEALRRFREEVARMIEEEGEPVDAALVSEGEAALISGGYEWQRWMADEACELFGSDWWEFVPKFGEVIEQRCALHLIGLKAALAQIAARDVKVSA